MNDHEEQLAKARRVMREQYGIETVPKNAKKSMRNALEAIARARRASERAQKARERAIRAGERAARAGERAQRNGVRVINVGRNATISTRSFNDGDAHYRWENGDCSIVIANGTVTITQGDKVVELPVDLSDDNAFKDLNLRDSDLDFLKMATQSNEREAEAKPEPRRIPVGMDPMTFKMLGEYGHGSVCSLRINALLEHLELRRDAYLDSPLIVKNIIDSSVTSPRVNKPNGNLFEQMKFLLGFGEDEIIKNRNFIPVGERKSIDDIGVGYQIGFMNETVGFYFDETFVPLIYLVDNRDVEQGCSIGHLNESLFPEAIGEVISLGEDEKQFVIGERDPLNGNKLLAAAKVIDLFINAVNGEDPRLAIEALDQISRLFDIEKIIYKAKSLSQATSYRKELITRNRVAKIINDPHFSEAAKPRFRFVERIDAVEGIQFDTEDVFSIVPGKNGSFTLNRNFVVVAGKDGNNFHSYQANFGPKLGDVQELVSNIPGVAVHPIDSDLANSFVGDDGVDFALEQMLNQVSGRKPKTFSQRLVGF